MIIPLGCEVHEGNNPIIALVLSLISDMYSVDVYACYIKERIICLMNLKA